MDDGLPATTSSLSPGWLDIFVVLGAILLVVIGTFIWAVFFRKKTRSRSRHRRQRADHHGRRPVNPTLAQIGGLPPVRQEEKPSDQLPPTPQS
jgi:heme/copper-type cytochrome/quinol oxidase subunit 2